jgi:DNA-directed RNA polymerase specialized sigma24 family protein
LRGFAVDRPARAPRPATARGTAGPAHRTLELPALRREAHRLGDRLDERRLPRPVVAGQERDPRAEVQILARPRPPARRTGSRCPGGRFPPQADHVRPRTEPSDVTAARHATDRTGRLGAGARHAPSRRPGIGVDSTAVLTTRIPSPPIEQELESYRRALTGYCYRILGSGSEAEDAVQETMVRAWRASDRLEGRGALKAWLYRIASNVCFDMLQGPQRRAQPMDLGPSSSADAPSAPALPETAWVQPIADARVLPAGRRPGRARAAARDAAPGVRRGAPAPAAAPARGPDPARGAALEGDGGRRAARHLGGVGQQRAAARPRDAREPGPRHERGHSVPDARSASC